MRLSGRGTWYIRDILSNCVIMCLKHCRSNNAAATQCCVDSGDIWKERSSFDYSSGNAVVEG